MPMQKDIKIGTKKIEALWERVEGYNRRDEMIHDEGTAKNLMFTGSDSGEETDAK